MLFLANLLQPYSVSEFFQHNWTSKAVVIYGEGKKKFTHLFSWEKLNYLLNYHKLKYPDLRLALDEKVLNESDNDNLIKLCQSGATLIVDQIHKLIPEVTQFAAEIKYDLGYSTQVNAYCSWPGRQGFSCHYDTHEVLILQVDGKKQWYVFTDTIKYPLTDQKSTSFSPREVDPYLSCTLVPGDILYIPRGHWHYAVALDEPSLHLTLGVHCKTRIDLLEWLVSELRQKEEWRKSLPLPVETALVKDSVDTLIQDLNQLLASHNIREYFISYFENIVKPSARYSFPYQAGFNIFPHGSETQFKNPKLQRVRISEIPDGSGYKIIAAGKEITLRGVPESFVRKLFSQDFFTGTDVMNWLPDFDWESDIVPLLSSLVTEGIIFVDN
ncbi:cupin domain-containing protein [Microseira wollei]|uniref:Cupin 4 n=1 Tax=Microseira wollei NIES-4236 TaxID=2530354 RepID=A0AAV3X4H2_9CYAN|nr:cupin domain-containing protein [Microseira wollei]GET37009.1 cupin 4 [Microseira wollei NIES-4236]